MTLNAVPSPAFNHCATGAGEPQARGAKRSPDPCIWGPRFFPSMVLHLEFTTYAFPPPPGHVYCANVNHKDKRAIDNLVGLVYGCHDFPQHSSWGKSDQIRVELSCSPSREFTMLGSHHSRLVSLIVPTTNQQIYHPYRLAERSVP
jgi:hypothetical protein